jgi:ATP-dependent Clp protease ATP-binding subunit ClpB
VLAVEGFAPVYWARPLKRAIQQKVVRPLAMRLLCGDFADGDTMVVDVQNGELDFTRGETRVPVMAEA